jgi:hypothetical protein
MVDMDGVLLMKEKPLAKKIREIDIYFIENVSLPNLNPYLSPAIDKVSNMLKALYDEVQDGPT